MIDNSPANMPAESPEQCIDKAIAYAMRYGQIDGDHHKAWVIDQMVRALLGCDVCLHDAQDVRGEHYTFYAQESSARYREFVRRHNEGDDGPETYSWDEGCCP